MKRDWEARERNERRRNIVVKEMEIKKSKKKGVRTINKKYMRGNEWRPVNRKVNKISGMKEMSTAKLEKEKQKREMMTRKKLLKERKEIIINNLTWRERKIK